MKALIIAAVVFAWSVRLAAAVCNTEDGNISDPEHAGINYELVLDGKIEVCDQSAEMPTDILNFARGGWNEVPNFAFFQAECLPPPSTRGVMVQDTAQGMCGGMVACADLPSNVPVRQFLRVYVTPSFAGLLEGEKKHVAGHELGHSLGFWHNVTCPAIMGPCDWESSLTPQAFDIANYYAAYEVEGVTNLTAVSDLPREVFLAWNQVNSEGELLCNESGFSILRGATPMASLDQDTTFVDFSGQPTGSQGYTVRSLTRAVLGAQGQTTTFVDVQAPPPEVLSAFLFGPAPVPISNTSGRYMWVIAEIANLSDQGMRVNFRTYIDGSRVLGCTENQQLILPGEETAWLLGGERKWILYRTRFECHSPAVPTTANWQVYFCVAAAGSGVEDCHSGPRTFIVQ